MKIYVIIGSNKYSEELWIVKGFVNKPDAENYLQLIVDENYRLYTLKLFNNQYDSKPTDPGSTSYCLEECMLNE